VALLSSQALAQPTVKAVATFSILADFVRQVGGARVEVKSLVGPNGDTHIYAPTPIDARTIAQAQIVFVNGLGYEGWITRLVEAAGGKVATVVASRGVPPRDRGVGGGDHPIDPHAWQSVANAKIYVANIRDGLAKADPAGAAVYAANADAYLSRLDALEADVKTAIAAIPPQRRRLITTHDAFGYFGAAYGIEFIASAGVSTDSEASARDMAKIITQIRREKVPAVFLENVSDPRLMQQIARETGVRIGGTLYSDALSGRDGPAATYIDMMRNNVRELTAALGN
jgi:zinc/manganese transport system substrate-binding protein